MKPEEKKFATEIESHLAKVETAIKDWTQNKATISQLQDCVKHIETLIQLLSQEKHTLEKSRKIIKDLVTAKSAILNSVLDGYISELGLL